MSEIAIHVENLGKSYQITHSTGRSNYKTLQEDMVRLLKSPFSRQARSASRETFWALRDISFDVKYGEVLGIIGRNGAGKSTLLKILSRITKPTLGSADIYGRIGSLLEVGTGFHPELTGRENIFLNGAVLGMSRRDIQKHFDEIVAFAEVEQFLDTPVKRYSSGMYMRLAFAVAAHLEPEVLIVDEVLAVGDAEFQKKCLGKMGEVAKSGRTVLFVSHNIQAIQALCSSGLLLDHGCTDGVKPLGGLIQHYQTMNIVSAGASFPIKRDDISVYSFSLMQQGMELEEFDSGAAIDIEVSFELHRALSGFRLGIYLKTLLGDIVFRSFIADWDPNLEKIAPGRYVCKGQIPAKFLAAGQYMLDLHASCYGIKSYQLENDVSVRILVNQPVDFNAAHLQEPNVQGVVLANLHWGLTSSP